MIGYNLIASPGRLANQMFKYAALKGISKNRNFDYCIPPSYQIIEKNKIVYKTATKYFFKKNKHNHKLFKAFEMALTDLKPLEIKISDVEESMSKYFSRVFEA